MYFNMEKWCCLFLKFRISKYKSVLMILCDKNMLFIFKGRYYYMLI